MGLFSKAQSAPPPSDSVRKLKETIELLEKREQHILINVNRELEKAKLNAKDNKKVALNALRRKKLYEEQIEKMFKAKSTLDTQIIAIESASTNLAVLDALMLGNKVLNHMHRHITPEKVEDYLADIQDNIALSNEISDAIGIPIGDVVDDEELMKELEQLENESSLPIQETRLDVEIEEGTPAKPIKSKDMDAWRVLEAEMNLT